MDYADDTSSRGCCPKLKTKNRAHSISGAHEIPNNCIGFNGAVPGDPPSLKLRRAGGHTPGLGQHALTSAATEEGDRTCGGEPLSPAQHHPKAVSLFVCHRIHRVGRETLAQETANVNLGGLVAGKNDRPRSYAQSGTSVDGVADGRNTRTTRTNAPVFLARQSSCGERDCSYEPWRKLPGDRQHR